MEILNQEKPRETNEKPRRVAKFPFQKGNPGGPGRPRLTAEAKLIKAAAIEEARRILNGHASKAAKKVTRLSELAKSENVQLSASQDVLDRVGITKAKEGNSDSQGNTYNLVFVLNQAKNGKENAETSS